MSEIQSEHASNQFGRGSIDTEEHVEKVDAHAKMSRKTPVPESKSILVKREEMNNSALEKQKHMTGSVMWAD